MKQRTKILFLGFCAGDRELILTWAEAGLMPTVKSLLSKGLSGPSNSLPGFFIGSTWESFATGVTPAKHGIYCWEQLKPGSYEQFRCLTHENFKVDAFWDHLSRAGRRVAVLDVPLSPYSKDINGIQLVEWGAHDAQYGFMTSPASLAQQVVARFGQHPWRGNCDANRGVDDFVQFRNDLMNGIATKAKLTRYFLDEGNWDIFLQVFTESHCVGHQCWHFHDIGHPWYKAENTAKVGNPVKDVYLAIDRAMGEVVDGVDDDTTIVFLAGHGMGPKYQAQFLLPQILLRLGVAAPVDQLETTGHEQAVRWRDRTEPLLSWGWSQLPDSLKSQLRPLQRGLRGWLDGRSVRPNLIDPAESLCFPVSNNFAHGGIRFNVIGREPQGKINRGAECDALFERLRKDLKGIVNLDNGKPIVRRVLRIADIYHGDYLDTLPDVVVEWSNHAPTYRIGSEKIGELQGEYAYCRSGEHHPGGFFIAVGPNIPTGRMTRPVSILDFAPTLSAMLGVDLSDIDGRPIPQLLGSRSGIISADPVARNEQI